MTALDITLDNLDWNDIGRQLDADGCAILPGLLGIDAARRLAGSITDPGLRKAALESGDLGRGELFFFGDDLPTPLGPLRAALYRRLLPVADRWNEAMGIAHRHPAEFADFRQRNRDAGQTRPQSHMSRLKVEDHVSLHQRNDGEVFPLQVVAVLSEPGADFQGGEFVTTEQRPRMQSRPGVVPLRLGDIAIIATAGRPFKGARGCYRVSLKHAVSRVRAGERIGLEIFFHDAP